MFDFETISRVDDAHAARRRYKKDLDLIKPDLVAYNRQKEIAMGLAPGTLVRPASSSSITNFNPTASVPNMEVPTIQFTNFDDPALTFGLACTHTSATTTGSRRSLS
jgi:SYF2 splicing factor